MNLSYRRLCTDDFGFKFMQAKFVVYVIDAMLQENRTES
jgi:hypothetical protein